MSAPGNPRVGVQFYEEGADELLRKLDQLTQKLNAVGQAGQGSNFGGGGGWTSLYSHPSNQGSLSASLPRPAGNGMPTGGLGAFPGTTPWNGDYGMPPAAPSMFPGGGNITLHATNVTVHGANVTLAGGTPVTGIPSGGGGGYGGGTVYGGFYGAPGGAAGAGAGAAMGYTRASFNIGQHADPAYAQDAANSLLDMRMQREQLRIQMDQERLQDMQRANFGGRRMYGGSAPSPAEGADEGGRGPSLGQALMGAGAAVAAHQLATFALGAGRTFGESYTSGGDLDSMHFVNQIMQSLPGGAGQVMGAIAGPFMEKAMAMRRVSGIADLLGTGTGLPRQGAGETDMAHFLRIAGVSPKGLQASEELLMHGLPPSRGVYDRMAIPYGEPGHINYGARDAVLGAYVGMRTSPFGIFATSAQSETRMGHDPFAYQGLAAEASGDWHRAVMLGAAAQGPGGPTPYRGLPGLSMMQQIETLQAGIIRPAVGMFGAQSAASLAYGDVDSAIKATHGSTSALEKDRTGYQALIGQSQDVLERAKRAGNLEAQLFARQRLTELNTGLAGVNEQVGSEQVRVAGMPLSMENRRGLERADYTIDVLNNTPGSYGNIRGALGSKFNLLEDSANQIRARMEEERKEARRFGRELNPEAEFAYERRLHDVGREQAGTYQQISHGWESRLISRMMGVPGGYNLNARGFSMMDAVYGGAVNPHFGATPGQLPHFLRESAKATYPVFPGVRGGIPGAGPTRLPWNDDLPIPGGAVPMPDDDPGTFPGSLGRPMGGGRSAGAGGGGAGDTPPLDAFPGGLPGRMPRGRAAAANHPGQDSHPGHGGPGGGDGKLEVHITLHDTSGRVLGEGSGTSTYCHVRAAIGAGGALGDFLNHRGIG